MGRYNRGMALRPVHRIKHVVDFSATLAKAVVLEIPLILAADAPVIASTTTVETGSKVNGIYLRVEIGSNDVADPGAIPNVYMAIMKNPGGQLAVVAPNAVGANATKKYIIHQEMVMIENTGQGGNTKTLFNGVVKIPKGYIRNGPVDELNLIILAPALDITVCVQCHYKEFR